MAFRLPTLLGLILLLVASPAMAEDPMEALRQEDTAALLEKFATLRREERRDELRTALTELVALHNLLASEAHRRRLQAVAGSMLGDASLGGLCMDAADALSQLKDPDGAWRQLRPHLPSVRDEAAGPVALRVLVAVGALAPDAALPALEELKEKAADLNVARHAIQALGGYGWSRRRLKVLEGLVETLRRLRPAGSDPRKGRNSGAEARERYNALQPALVDALNRLTGQQLAGPDQWFEALEANKKDPEQLFRNRRP